MSKTDSLFEAEATLRMRAIQFADKDHRPGGVTTDAARKNLRDAAIAYASIATEIDDCFGGAEP